MRWFAVCLALVLLGGCKQSQNKPVFIDPALEILVPPDTTVATGADLDAIRTTHVFQKYIGELKLPQLTEFTRPDREWIHAKIYGRSYRVRTGRPACSWLEAGSSMKGTPVAHHWRRK